MMNSPQTSNHQASRSQVVTMLAIGFSIIWNFITNSFPPTGVTIAKLSETVFADVKIIPANYAFSIWGVIYLGLTAFGFYQLDARRAENFPLQKTRPWIVITCLLQCTWILLFLYQQMLLSSLVMLGILWSLIQCYRSLRFPQTDTHSLYPNWIPQVFSLYLGWISVATIVNIASTFNMYGWQGGGISPAMWTVIMLIVSVCLALVLLKIYHDRVFGGAIVWAIGGIIFANLSSPAIVLSGLVAIAILITSLLQPSTLSS